MLQICISYSLKQFNLNVRNKVTTKILSKNESMAVGNKILLGV